MTVRGMLAVLLLLACAAPSAAFDIGAYADYLNSNRGIDYQVLRERHEPQPHHRSDLHLDLAGTDYLSNIDEVFGLTEDEETLLAQNGFVVTERLQYWTWEEPLAHVWHRDLPLYISSDLILHTLHTSFATILMNHEALNAAPALELALAQTHASWDALAARYADQPAMLVHLRDLDLWLTVTRSLLAGERIACADASSDAPVDELLAAIAAEGVGRFALFNEDSRTIDFSQFKPRGFYTQSVVLQRYFRAMMWLGRVEFRLTIPPGAEAPASVQREVVDAFLVRELLELAGSRSSIESLDEVFRLLVGESDNSTLSDLDSMASDLGIVQASDLLDAVRYARFEELLSTDTYQPQAINSRILLGDPMRAEPLQPPYAFLLLGQRFTVDSYVFGNVVYDQVPFPFRGLPSPLDVLYALGNDDVIPLLKDELQAYPYAPNLAAMRYLIESYDEEFWDASVYNRWISAIRTLSGSRRPDGVPEFMKTGAWQQKQMTTQLTSWAELRHDTILHVKQSYSGGVICSTPEGFVEPLPELYREIGDLARFFEQEIVPKMPDSGLTTGVGAWTIRVQETMQTLVTIAEKELRHEALSEEEGAFLRGAYATAQGCGAPGSGWVAGLAYRYFDSGRLDALDLVVADVHTQPTDEFGAMVGKVLHVGTLPPRLAVVIAGCPSTDPVAYIGPVASMRQYVSNSFRRLTDEEWSGAWRGTDAEWSIVIPFLSTAPWEKIYSADREGRLQEGPSILTEYSVPITDPEERDTPPSAGRAIAWLRASPNPFNPRTEIGFQITGSGPVAVRVGVYDVRGSRVRTLLDEPIQPNTWLLPWDGTDDTGRPVSSGVYFAVVDADGERRSTKMVMVR